MFNIDDSTAAAVKPAKDAAGAEGYFTPGDPGLGEAATVVEADFLNMVQDELRTIVEGAGLVPDKADDGQVFAAIQSLIADSATVGALTYKGTWDASGGVYPTAPAPVLGDYYKISVAGTMGGVDYAVGDSTIFNSVDWDKIDNTEQVTSVNGQVGAVVLVGDAANQAEMEAATSDLVSVTPLNQKWHPSSAKAWVIFDGTGTVAILDSYNVTSITDHGTGDYSANLTTPMSSANFPVGVAAGSSITNPGVSNTAAVPSSTSSIRAEVHDSNGTNLDRDFVSLTAFGDQ